MEFARSLKKKADQETTAPTTTFNVFVGNLAWRVRSRDLRELFGSSGKLISAEVIFQSNPRRSAGYGFVSYATEEEAKAAIAAHNEKVKKYLCFLMDMHAKFCPNVLCSLDFCIDIE